MKKLLILFLILPVFGRMQLPADQKALTLADFSSISHKIVYESFRNGSYDLYITSADASWRRQLTDTKNMHEMYPKVSPDGKLIAFSVDTGEGRARRRDLYLMKIDGSGRKLLSRDSREHCWSPDGRYIAFVKSESARRFSGESWATKGLFFYDMQSGQVTEHANKKLEHLYNLCWSPGGKYITATVLGGMGFRHTDIAIEAWGSKYFQLGIVGCRPEFSPDGKKIGWGQSDRDFRIAKIDFSRRPPVSQKDIVGIIQVTKGYEVYHLDWSPDGRYIAFSCGPDGEQAVGGMAPGWNICILELSTGRWLNITWDGNHNKEPDWVPLN